MGLFELLGELFNPDPVGKISFNDKDSNLRKKLIPIRFIISLMIIGIVEYLMIFKTGDHNDLTYLLTFNIGLLLYLLTSKFINIEPEYDNLGWVPFLINNPFRLSDNVNRLLVILKLLFSPGKWISKSIVGFFQYLKGKQY